MLPRIETLHGFFSEYKKLDSNFSRRYGNLNFTFPFKFGQTLSEQEDMKDFQVFLGDYVSLLSRKNFRTVLSFAVDFAENEQYQYFRDFSQSGRSKENIQKVSKKILKDFDAFLQNYNHYEFSDVYVPKSLSRFLWEVGDVIPNASSKMGNFYLEKFFNYKERRINDVNAFLKEKYYDADRHKSKDFGKIFKKFSKWCYDGKLKNSFLSTMFSLNLDVVNDYSSFEVNGQETEEDKVRLKNHVHIIANEYLNFLRADLEKNKLNKYAFVFPEDILSKETTGKKPVKETGFNKIYRVVKIKELENEFNVEVERVDNYDDAVFRNKAVYTGSLEKRKRYSLAFRKCVTYPTYVWKFEKGTVNEINENDFESVFGKNTEEFYVGQIFSEVPDNVQKFLPNKSAYKFKK